MDIDLVQLTRALFRDLGVDKKTSDYVLTRLKNEGVSVVTSLLPSFSKHVLLCIEQGYWTYFGTSIKTKRGLPVIFRGYLLELFTFDPETQRYVVRMDADPVALMVIRQACEYLYKLSLDMTPEQQIAARTKFLDTDADIPSYGEYDEDFVDAMRKNFETYYPSAKSIDIDDVSRAAHPGSGTYSWSDSGSWWKRNYLHPTVKSEHQHLSFGLRFNKRAPRPGVAAKESTPDFSEVLFVPKDSRGPRVIVREPYENLLFQMGYFSQMSTALEKDTNYRINFISQGTNRELARVSSINRRYSTLDLSDASDRVSYAIVRHLFRFSPVLKVFDMFRTNLALPNSRGCRIAYGGQYTKEIRKKISKFLVPLRKLAGMGSGLTFPTMALVIHLAICTRVSQVFNHLTYEQISSLVYVYGDDIIIPTVWYDFAVESLSRVGLKTNLAKSFKNSFFRESCGGDYLYGNDVTPTRLKLTNVKLEVFGHKVRPVFETSGSPSFYAVALDSHCKELYKNQLFGVCRYLATILKKFVEKGWGVTLPLVGPNSKVIGIPTNNEEVYSRLKVGPAGDYKKVRVLVVTPEISSLSEMCPYQFLRKSLTQKVERQNPWRKDLYPAGSSAEYGSVPQPRRIKIRVSKEPSIILTDVGAFDRDSIAEKIEGLFCPPSRTSLIREFFMNYRA